MRITKNLLVLISAFLMYFTGLRIILPILPLYLRSAGISIAELGIISSSFGLGLIAFEPVWGWLSDKVGRRKIIAPAALVSSLSVLLYTLTEDPWTFFTVNFLQGVIVSAVGATSRALMADLSIPSKRGRAFGIWWTTFTLSYIIGPAVGGYVASRMNYTASFYISSVFFIMSFLLMVNIVETKRRAMIRKTDEKIGLNSKSSKSLTITCYLIFFYYFCLSVINNLLPVFINESTEIKATEIEVGFMFTIMYVVATATQLLFGELSDKIGSKILITVGMALSGLAFLAVPIVKSIVQVYFSVAVFAIGGATINPTMMALLTKYTSPVSYGKAIGFYGAAEDLGLVLGPLIIGFIYEFWAASVAFYLCATLMFFDAVCAFLLLKTS